MEDSYCRHKQDVYLTKEGIINDFLNFWTSSNQQRDVMIETSKKKEPEFFETNDSCMYADDEQPLEDMFMYVAEEMQLLEEMEVIEQFLIDHVFKDTRDGQVLKTTKEDEDDESSKTW